MYDILVATRDGLYTFDERGRDGDTDLAGRSVTAVVRDGPELWAIVDGTQTWHAARASGVASRRSTV